MSAVLLHPHLRDRGAGREPMRLPEFPLVVQVRARSHGDALLQAPPCTTDGAVSEAVHGGWNVYAAEEAAAYAAVDALLADCGAQFDCYGPEVRYWPGQPMLEPVMAIDVRLPLVFGAFVRREIQRRKGTVHATEPARHAATVRGEAPLATLLGFGQWLDALTDRRADVRTSLVRYAPVGSGGPSPGPLAA